LAHKEKVSEKNEKVCEKCLLYALRQGVAVLHWKENRPRNWSKTDIPMVLFSAVNEKVCEKNGHTALLGENKLTNTTWKIYARNTQDTHRASISFTGQH
jgi:hypothetical protein